MSTVHIILLCALVTYGSRAGGYLVMSYFGQVHHRVMAGLNAVPIAVLSALVAPQIVTGHWTDAAAIGLVCLMSLRLPLLPSVLLGVISLVAMRSVLGL